MIEKKIDIYYNEPARINLNNAELICELNNSYAILTVVDIVDKKIVAYEYFEFDAFNNLWSNIFNELKSTSKILSDNYTAVRFFYNFSEVLVVPSLYDNEDNSKIYLTTFYNSLKSVDIKSDKLSAFDNVSVIYSVEEEFKHAVSSYFKPSSQYHSYSKLLQTISQTQLLPSQQSMWLLFYNQMFAVILTDGLQLKFIKSVYYKTAEDVLYFVLNISKQYIINAGNVNLNVSGFINEDSEEFIILQKHFSHIVLSEPPVTKISDELFNGYPKQYFAPLFYLLA